MERWYALYTVVGKEQEAADLLSQVVSSGLWSGCQIPKKTKVFRSGGILHLLEDVMFPGYVFVKTAYPKELAGELQRARKFPQFIGNIRDAVAPVEEKDLHFLQDVCGENLQQVMGVSSITLNEENRILIADGVLAHYIDQIVKLNLRKRFAVVEVELFNRTQTILFGLRLKQDQAG